MHVYRDRYRYVYIYTYIYICIYVYMYMYMWTHKNTHIHACTHTHTHTHMYYACCLPIHPSWLAHHPLYSTLAVETKGVVIEHYLSPPRPVTSHCPTKFKSVHHSSFASGLHPDNLIARPRQTETRHGIPSRNRGNGKPQRLLHFSLQKAHLQRNINFDSPESNSGLNLNSDDHFGSHLPRFRNGLYQAHLTPAP